MGADQSKENHEKDAAAAAADSKATEAEKAAKAAQLQKQKEAPKAPPSVGHTLWRTCLLAKGMLFLVVGAMHLLEENVLHHLGLAAATAATTTTSTSATAHGRPLFQPPTRDHDMLY